MRWIATGLLLAMAGLFALSRQMDWPMLRAFAEAAMVGALADWFAVTALFRHPLGLPIPHTAIIPANKDRIADTMAGFLQDNFLTPHVVARRLKDMNLAKAAGDYLVQPGQPGEGGRIRAGAAGLLADLLESLDPDRLGNQLRAGLARQAEKLEIAPLLGGVMSAAIADGRHRPVLDSLIRWAGLTLEANEALVRGVIHERASALLRWTGLDERLANSVLDGLYRLFAEVLVDPDHPLRAKVEEAIVTLTRQAAQMDDIANARFTALADRNTAFQIELESNEAETQAAIRSRAALLSKELEQTRRLLDSHEAESLISLRARLSALRDEGAAMARALRDSEATAVANWQGTIARIATELGALDGEITARHARITDTTGALGAATQAATDRFAAISTQLDHISGAEGGLADLLAARLDSLTRSLGDTESHIDRLSDSSVRLLELIQSSASHSREQLPAALQAGEALLAAHEERVRSLREAVEATRADGTALAAQIAQAQSGLGDIATLQTAVAGRFDHHDAALGALNGKLATLETDTARIAAEALVDLVSAVTSVSDAARLAIQSIESDGAKQVAALADQLAGSSGAALERSMRHRFPYIDPLHHLQVELIRRYREGKRPQDRDEKAQRGIHISINGISAGLRNTG